MMLKPDLLPPNDLRNMKKLSKFDNFKVWSLLGAVHKLRKAERGGGGGSRNPYDS